jgi:hypothetical protein
MSNKQCGWLLLDGPSQSLHDLGGESCHGCENQRMDKHVTQRVRGSWKAGRSSSPELGGPHWSLEYKILLTLIDITVYEAF